MNNKIKAVALAVLGTCAFGVQAQSSITLQGLVDVNVQNIKRSGTGYLPGERTSQTSMDSNGMTTSWWGLSGTEALGGGFRAVFALQGFFRPDTGEGGRFGTTDILFKRAASAGLEHSSYGRLILGRQSTHYFLSTVQTNPFGDSFGFSPAILNTFGTALGGGLGVRYARDRFLLGDSGWSNAVQYATPSFKGFSAAVMWSANSISNGQEDGTQAGRAVSGQAFYRGGPFVATAVYQDLRPNAIDQIQKSLMVGGAYDLKVVRLFVQYFDMDTRQAAGTDADIGWQLGASVPFAGGKHNLLASYFMMATDAQTGPTVEEERTTWAVGYRYDVSRRTDLYAVFLNDELEATAPKERRSIGLGMRHRF